MVLVFFLGRGGGFGCFDREHVRDLTFRTSDKMIDIAGTPKHMYIMRLVRHVSKYTHLHYTLGVEVVGTA